MPQNIAIANDNHYKSQREAATDPGACRSSPTGRWDPVMKQSAQDAGRIVWHAEIADLSTVADDAWRRAKPTDKQRRPRSR